MTIPEKLNEVVRFIENKCSLKPKVGIVLGSGLGEFANRIQNATTFRYSEIPHFLPTTVEGHEGKLHIGTIEGVPVALLQGRLHYYEGHSMEQVAFPVRSLCRLGIHTLVLTNAAGGINPSFREADLMMIVDHINLMGDNPLIGPNLKGMGPRFPDLTEAYNYDCQNIFRIAAKNLETPLKEGVYVALCGPTYETPAEIKMMRILGADAVGMSTVPEVIAANHFGVRVAAISCITNLAAGITTQKLSHEEVMVNAGQSVNKMMLLLEEALPELAKAGRS